MISIKEMKECEGKRIRLTFDNVAPIEGFCQCYLQAEDEDEEPMLEVGKYLINQSEIKTLEILEDEK